MKTTTRPNSKPRFIQHKQEAYWYYRFLSILYYCIINSCWTEDMREEALEPLDLCSRDLIVVDVGGGTGFTTMGMIDHVDAKNIIILDQSPHQLAKAKEKEPLKECKFTEGDAEDLPFPTDHVDRYVSAGRFPLVLLFLIFIPKKFYYSFISSPYKKKSSWLIYDGCSIYDLYEHIQKKLFVCLDMCLLQRCPF